MKIQTTIEYGYIKISEPLITDTYRIEQGEDGRFYITSNNGYNGYEGDGYTDITKAMANVKRMIKEYFLDRCEKAPKGW